MRASEVTALLARAKRGVRAATGFISPKAAGALIYLYHRGWGVVWLEK